jgi:hypothetical protein
VTEAKAGSRLLSGSMLLSILLLLENMNKNAITNVEIINLNDQVKEDEMGRACSTNGGEEECI